MRCYAAEIRTIMMEVLYSDEETKGLDLSNGEVPEGAVVVPGVVQTYGFHPERLLKAAPRIKSVLEKVVKDEFMREKGWSFFVLCYDREAEQWGDHSDAEALVVLSVALGWARYTLPRMMWRALPGGLPLVRFHFQQEPKLYYPLDLDELKKPRQLSGEDLRRYKTWLSISKLPPQEGGAVIGKELWERYMVDLEDIRKLTPLDRVWVLTNTSTEPNTEEVRAFLGDNAAQVEW